MADYGRVAFVEGQAVVNADGGHGRVVFVEGQAVIVSEAHGRVVFQEGQAVVTPTSEFRLTTMLVEVFIEPREIDRVQSAEQGGAIRTGVGAAALRRGRRK